MFKRRVELGFYAEESTDFRMSQKFMSATKVTLVCSEQRERSLSA